MASLKRTFSVLLLFALFMSGCQPLVAPETGVAPEPEAVALENKIQDAMSAGPSVIAQDATILDYPEGWPGNWPNEPAPEYVELRPGSNGWSCVTDNPTTPGHDPMCLNETQLAMVQARNALIAPPSTGYGVGYMLQGGGPVGSPPHIMIFTPGSREDLIALSTDMNPITWANGWNMYSETPYAHLMIAAPPQPEAVSVEEDKIANAMSAGPAVIVEEATILDYPEGWPGNWPNEPAPEYVELRPGSNGWACIVDDPNTPGNDPMCLSETQLAMVKARYALIDPHSTGIGIGYMLQGGGPVGSPPHIMIFTPGSREDLIALSTDMNPITWANGWNMYSDTPYAHLMIAVPQPSDSSEAAAADNKVANALSAGPRSVTDKAAVVDWPSDSGAGFSELRAGTNGWTCIPDMPSTPTIDDPMCLDEQWMEWLTARLQGRAPEITALGWSYMLQGGAAASDSDPDATVTSDDDWLIDPPHLMVLVPGELDTSYFPTSRESGEPYIMWGGTPYEHFMLPMELDVPLQTDDKVANALSAGPRSVTDKAAVVDWPSETNPEFSELRSGTNGWTCIPDVPDTPTINDPMCLDEQWMEWLTARIQGRAPEITALGWSYMLQGGAAASDADPDATVTSDDDWLIDPPHLMVLVPGELDTSYFPTSRESGEPYIMWGGTPYEHFMASLPE